MEQAPSNSKNRIKLILLDMDNTMYGFSGEEPEKRAEDKALSYLSQELSLPIEELREKFGEARKSIRGSEDPLRSSRKRWFSKLLEYLQRGNKNISAKACEIYEETACKSIMPYEDFLKFLDSIDNRYMLAIVTNGEPEFQKRKLRAIGLESRFQHFFSAACIGKLKSKEFYEAVLKKLGFSPQETIIIGDNPKRDILPAKEVGITTIWLKRGKYSSFRFGEEKPDYTIVSFKEVLSILKELFPE